MSFGECFFSATSELNISPTHADSFMCDYFVPQLCVFVFAYSRNCVCITAENAADACDKAFAQC